MNNNENNTQYTQHRQTDKVFDNSYNTGDLDNFSTEPIVLNENYKRTFLKQEYDSDTMHRLTILSEELYSFIQGSRFEPVLSNIKILKNIIPEILEYILPFLEEKTDYSFAEKFYVVCELIDVKESLIYNQLPTSYKDQALKEINEYSNVENKQKNNRLF